MSNKFATLLQEIEMQESERLIGMYANHLAGRSLENLEETKSKLSARISLGPIEIYLTDNDVNSFRANYEALLKMVNENDALFKSVTGQLGIKPVPVAQVIEAPSGLQDKSITEVVKEARVKSHADGVLLVVYYLFKIRGTETVNSKDVNDALAEARLSGPKNISDTLNKLVSMGKLRKAQKKDGKKAFSLTQTGEQAAIQLLERGQGS